MHGEEQKLKFHDEELIQEKQQKNSTKEFSSDEEKEYYGEGPSGTMEKTTQVTKRMLLSLLLLLPLAIFLLEIMFVLKLKKYLYFIKLCIYEKR